MKKDSAPGLDGLSINMIEKFNCNLKIQYR